MLSEILDLDSSDLVLDAQVAASLLRGLAIDPVYNRLLRQVRTLIDDLHCTFEIATFARRALRARAVLHCRLFIHLNAPCVGSVGWDFFGAISIPTSRQILMRSSSW